MTPMDDETSPKKRGLGRGLNALFGDEEQSPLSGGEAGSALPAAEESPSSSHRRMIGIGQIVAGEFQPRHQFNDKSIEELAQSIGQHGLLQPILVRPKPGEPGTYEIVAGERRWRAAQKAQLHEVPVIIRDLDDTTTLEIALIENLQREDLNPIDEARALAQLAQEFSYTQEQIAEKVGKSRSYVTNMIRLTELSPGVVMLVSEGKLSAGHARALLTLSADQQEEQAKKIVALGLSVRQTEKLVNDLHGRPSKQKLDKLGKKIEGETAAEKDINTLALEREISNVLGMSVSIDMKTTQEGRLSISFTTLDQLDEVLHRLSHNPGKLAIRG
jgi:ParB family chromosome partitioning protein